MPAAIEINDLRKSYGDTEAVRGLDLTVERGEVFALLGPNGAGKTTTVEILEGHRRRDSGSVSVLGFDPGSGDAAFRRRIGIVLQETAVEPYLTVGEAIEMYGGYYPSPRSVDEVIEVVGLQDKRDARINKLSGGQQRRLDVGIGLAGDPDLLFLDEPTTGFDPSARRAAWEMVRNLRSLGKTVFLTTHYMEEAQALANRVGIIADGRLVAEGPPSSLMNDGPSSTRIVFSIPAAHSLPEDLSLLATRHETGWQITTDEPTRVLHILTSWSLDQGIALDALQVSRPTLEDVYLHLTGKAEDQQ
ncbi:MAG: ABC transporter ATP-binding protein [Actinomycetota bacterium]